MKTIQRSLLAILLLTFIFAGCNKYADGPKFSLLTKKSRLCGDWKIDKVTVNDNDVTNDYKTLVGGNYVLDIEKSGSYKVLGNFPDEGTWKFGEDKDDVYFTSTKNPGPEQAYRILRLKSKELWLRSTASNGDKTIIHYVPAD